jgi:hypothetical protein
MVTPSRTALSQEPRWPEQPLRRSRGTLSHWQAAPSRRLAVSLSLAAGESGADVGRDGSPCRDVAADVSGARRRCRETGSGPEITSQA